MKKLKGLENKKEKARQKQKNVEAGRTVQVSLT